MASGHVSRIERPNTWPHRPRLHARRFLANSEPSTHGGIATDRYMLCGVVSAASKTPAASHGDAVVYWVAYCEL